MARDVIRLMHSLFVPAVRNCGDACWCPPADVYRTATGWAVKLDLAGVRPEDVRLHREGSRLVVTGSRRDLVVQEGHRHYCMEISYSRFERGVDLPVDLEQARLSTDYRDGMLLIRIETEESNP